MPPTFFNLELCKALFDLAANVDPGVPTWPLSILMVLRHYQSYMAYGLTASIIISFFIGQLYLVQIQHLVAIIHAFAIHLHRHHKYLVASKEKRMWLHKFWS